jgi:dimethylglycine dehydrogenase
MVGLELPVLAMEHMYLLTEDMPEVIEFNEKMGRELIHVIDFKGEIYTRQEGGASCSAPMRRPRSPGRR